MPYMSQPTSPTTKLSRLPPAEEAFSLLSDNHRIDILRAIWEANDRLDPVAVPFTDIRDRVDIDDPGQLNYHLNRLTDHFIRRTSNGYVLREAGRRMFRVLISGTAISEPSIEPVEIDAECVFCGAPTLLSYEDGWRYLECTECDAQCVESYPDGVLSRHELPPSGVVDRTPNEIHEADLVWSHHRRASVIDGICPDCAGPMPVASLEVCEDHSPSPDYDEVCESCGSIFWTEVISICGICGSVWKMPIQFHLVTHPEVVAFYHEHGIDFHLATYEHRPYLLTYREELLSEDPLRIQTTIPLGDDELHVVVDGEATVIEVRR